MYQANVKDESGEVVASIFSPREESVMQFMRDEIKKRKMRDARPRLFRKSHMPIFKNRKGEVMRCNFLLIKKL